MLLIKYGKTIYNGQGRFEYLYPHLRTSRHKRQRRFDRKKRCKISIPAKGFRFISGQKKEIDNKKRVGDWYGIFKTKIDFINLV